MLLRPILRNNQYFAASFSTLRNVKQKANVISYLVDTVGLSQEKAITASKKVYFDSPDKPNAVVSFLERRGFSKSQISELVRRLPQVLVSDPEKTLLPKIEVYSRCTGFPEEDVCSFFVKYPMFLTNCSESRFGPLFEYLKDILGVERVGTLLLRGSWIFSIDLERRLKPNVDYLRSLGVGRSFIELSLTHCSAIYWPKPSEFRRIVEEVKGMGFDHTKSTFILALNTQAVKGNLVTWDRCYETYSKWGWSKNDILMAYRKHPYCMLMSEKKISLVLDFLVNELGRESRSMAEAPHILLYSVENRIIPRCSIAHLLCSNGLIQKNWSLSSVLCSNEKRFREKYVIKYADKLPELHDTYLSMITKAADALFEFVRS